jgi:heme O synthase-like polyprenyltransferase
LTIGSYLFCLYAAQAHHDPEHGHRRHSRRASAADGLDGGARRNHGGRLVAVRHSLFWQLPHFLAIAWMYRDQYAKAGFVMLPVVDPTGETDRPPGLEPHAGPAAGEPVPFLFKMVGPVYLAGPWCWGSPFFGARFSFPGNDLAAGAPLFFASIIYLPSLLGLMVLDKT